LKTKPVAGKTMLFECPSQESHFKLSITNQKDEDLWKDPSNASMRS